MRNAVRILLFGMMLALPVTAAAQDIGQYVMSVDFVGQVKNTGSDMKSIRYTIDNNERHFFVDHTTGKVDKDAFFTPAATTSKTYSVNDNIPNILSFWTKRHWNGTGSPSEDFTRYTIDLSKPHTNVEISYGDDGKRIIQRCEATVRIKFMPKKISLFYFNTSGIADNNKILPDEGKITLKATKGFIAATYNWQYSVNNGTTWINFPSRITAYKNNKSEVTFSATELFGSAAAFRQYIGNSIRFRINATTADSTQLLILNARHTAPSITAARYESEKCHGSGDAVVYLTMSRALHSGEVLYIKNENQISEGNKTVTPDANKVVTLTGIEAGSYRFAASSAINGSQAAAANSWPLTVASQPEVKHEILDFSHASCHGGADGTITAAAEGGTGSFTGKLYLSSQTTPLSEKTFTTSSSLVFNGLTAGTYYIEIYDSNGCTTYNNGGVVRHQVIISQPQSAVKATLEQSTQPLAYDSADGSVTIRVGGGTKNASGYNVRLTSAGGSTHALSSASDSGADIVYSFAGLPRGSYTFAAQDANYSGQTGPCGCAATIYFNLDAPAPLSVTITETHKIDWHGGNQGELTATGSGGVAPYTYTWYKDGAVVGNTNLTAGNYTVKITDANGVSAMSAIYTLTQPAQIELTLTTTAVKCHGGADGSITASATGGSGKFSGKLYKNDQLIATQSFTSSKKFDGLSAGTYRLDVIDTDCGDHGSGNVITQTATVAQPASPVAIELVQTASPLAHDSADGRAVVKVTGGTKSASGYEVTLTSEAGQTYALSSADDETYTFGGLPSGRYIVSAKDANAAGQTEPCGCTATMYFNIDAPAALSVTIAETHAIHWYGGAHGELAATGAGGVLPYAYTWYRDGAVAGNTGLTAGNYQVKITDANGVSAMSAIYTLTQPTAVTVTHSAMAASCHGGADGSITVSASGGTGNFTGRLYKDGQPIATHSFSSSKMFEGLSAGVYRLDITDMHGCTEHENIITNTITVGQPAAPVAIALEQVIPPLAHDSADGRATFRVSGGTKSPAGYSVTLTSESGQVYTLSSSSDDGADVLYIYTGLPGGNYTVSAKDANAAGQTGPCGCAATMDFSIEAPPALSVEIKETHTIHWHGGDQGELTATGAGGVAPYTYTWYKEGAQIAGAKVATGLKAGEYTVKITDANGISATSAIHTLGEPTAIKVEVASADATCHGGADGHITASATGGAGEFVGKLYRDSQLIATHTFTESSKFERLTAGVYKLDISDTDGCGEHTDGTVRSRSITIGQPVAPVAIAVAEIVEPLAHYSTDGRVTIKVSGGTPHASGYTVTFESESGQVYNLSSASQDGDNMLYIYTGLRSGNYVVTARDANYASQAEPCGCASTMYFTMTAPPALTVGIEETHYINWYGGNQGELTAHGAGGVGSYKYVWYKDNIPVAEGSVATGLTAGRYQVKITDANGISTTSAVYALTQPTEITITLEATDVSGYGGKDGKVKAVVSGGVPPYSYEWNVEGERTAEISGLETGFYMLKVTDKLGGTKSATAAVASPDGIVISPEIKQPSFLAPAAGGSVKLAISGGTAPYTVVWSDSGSGTERNGLTPGTYTVTVTDAKGYKNMAAFVLDEPYSFTVSLGDGFTMCRGQNRTIEARCDEPDVKYEWYLDDVKLDGEGAGITVDKAGYYKVKAVNPEGCSAEDEIQVKISADVLNLELAVPTRVEAGTEIHAVNLSKITADRIEWTIPEGSILVSKSDMEIVFTINAKGRHVIAMEGFKGEGASIITRTIDVVGKGEVGLPDDKAPLIKQFLVTPNPSTGYFKVFVELLREEDFTMTLYSPAGVLMDTKEERGVQSKTFEYEVNGSLQGTYTVHLTTGTDKSVQQIEIRR